MLTIFYILLSFLSQLVEITNSQEFVEKYTYAPKEGLEIIGTKAPPLDGLKWLNSDPLDIERIAGNVVLIRFWLVDCPLCENTAPSLVNLYKKYKDEGLLVIGIHHPKSEETRDPGLVLSRARALGFDFPIAQDNDWKVLKSYWLKGENRSFTSVTFLIDKNGVIRFIHDGGEFYKSDKNFEANNSFQEIEKKIQELLEEKIP